MNVERVRTRSGSRIDPPMNESWSDLEKLQWHASVAKVDCGVDVTVSLAEYRTRIMGVWVKERGYYSVAVARGSISPLDFRSAWSYINGVVAGVKVVRNG